MKKYIVVSVSILSALISVITHASTPAVQWSVSKHSSLTTSEYSNAKFDEVITEANQLIDYLDSDCGDDVACALEIERNGDVSTFTDPSGMDLEVIDTLSKLVAVLNLPGRVKVVREVNFCGNSKDKDFVGCGDVNNDSFVVEYGAAPQTYLHEYIHNESTNGDHRNDCEDYVMNECPQCGKGNTIDSSECTRMGGHVFTEIQGSIYDGSGGPLTTTNDPYFMTYNITVPAGKTLTINPGVKIQVDDGYSFKGPPGGKVIGSGSSGTRIYSRCSNIHPCTL